MFGAPDTIRTCDPLVRSQVLYPAELRVRKLFKTIPSTATKLSCIVPTRLIPNLSKINFSPLRGSLRLSAELRSFRTCDPLVRSQVLYPAELRVRKLFKTIPSYFPFQTP
jgi:hypothetical protein